MDLSPHPPQRKLGSQRCTSTTSPRSVFMPHSMQWFTNKKDPFSDKSLFCVMASIGVTVTHTTDGLMGRLNHVNLPRGCRVTLKPLPPWTERGLKRFGTILADVVGRVPWTGYKASSLLDVDIDASLRIPLFFYSKWRRSNIVKDNCPYLQSFRGRASYIFPSDPRYKAPLSRWQCHSCEKSATT